MVKMSILLVNVSLMLELRLLILTYLKIIYTVSGKKSNSPDNVQ